MSEEDYLPDSDDDLDYGDLKVNFSKEEAEAKGYVPIPAGEYHFKITDCELVLSKSEKNKGKPMWKVELTVQEGKYEGRKVITNIMLWSGALYACSQMMKALGYDIEAGEFKLPNPNTFIGESVICKVLIKPATDQYEAGNNVKTWKSYDSKTPTAGEASLLP